MKKVIHVVGVVILLLHYHASPAQIPRTISYQGVLSDTSDTPRPDGTYPFTFRLYETPSGGTQIWFEAKLLPVKRGLFSTVMGDITPFPDSLKFNRPYWLSLQIGDDPELAPRAPLTSVGYSFNSARADTARFAQVSGSGSGSGPWTTNGNNIYFNGGKVGIGTSTPVSKLDILAQDGLGLSGYQPFLTLKDTASANARTRIQNANGDLSLFTESDFATGTPALTIKSSGSRLTVLGQDALNMVGYQPFVTLADANSGYARTRIQSANGDFNFFTNSDLSSGIPAVSIRSAPAGSRLLVQSQDGLNTVGYQPFLTLTDGNAGYRRGRMQSGNGDVLLYTETGIVAGVPNFSIKDVTGNVGIGTPNPTARLEVVGRTKTGTLEITGGSDLAEPFEAETSIEPGTIMSINPQHPGTLQQSIMAYDTRVAGIVSGAGDVHPGLTLRQDNMMSGNTLIAIAGRVYCKAEALTIPIEPGDLLTTSSLPGYAMQATDKERSRGAIIGKAMSTLKSGKGLVLVLVNLQ